MTSVTNVDMDATRPFHPHPSGAETEVGSGGLPAIDAGNDGIRGTVRIAPAVLIELIALAVRDVTGVVDFHPRRRVERILPRGGHGSSADQDTTASTFEASGIRVRVHGSLIDADVTIVIVPDVNILELSRNIQRQVGVAVGRMLGMTVNEVNVYVAGVAAAPEAER